MSIYRREGSAYWWVHVQVGNQSIRRSTKTKDKRKAEEVEADIRKRLYDDLHNAQLNRAPRRTFGEALRRWLTSDAKTLKSYNNIVDKATLVDRHLNAVWLTDVPDAAQRMKGVFIAQGLKPATINRRLAIVRRVLNLSYSEWGWLDRPLGKKIMTLSGEESRHEYLTAAEIVALADAAGPARNAILFLAYTGLRRSELLRVTDSDRRDGMLVLSSNTKSGKPRAIPLPQIIQDIPLPITLRAHTLRKHFEEARVAIGRPTLRLHDLRHSYASLLIQAGVGLAVVRDLLGHAHLGVTSRYTHLENSHLVQAVEKFTSQFATQAKRETK